MSPMRRWFLWGVFFAAAGTISCVVAILAAGEGAWATAAFALGWFPFVAPAFLREGDRLALRVDL